MPALIFSIGASFTLAAPASAQDEPGQANPSTGYVEALKTCQSIADDTERLNCYDAAVGRVVTASDQGEVQIVDAEAIEQNRRRLFGFSLPKIGLFGGAGAEETDQLLESVITGVRASGRNTLFITIAEGDAVWRITGASALTMRTKVGDPVVFKEAAMGSYFIRINGRTGVKGRRVE
ncbi:hypothetical protein GRI36_05700 [Altererythrobacter gangjinensis]|uniref:Uncharacterized protein n=1 Tax=Pontixanthobacter gangjinensis TaxID=1028742 RepID=A0A6I4SKH3_9SPHN|nr:hypothetical protein [Pontixanthobacter gangjinensis]